MLSIPDMALLGAFALLFFGPDQLPRVVRKVGQFTREVQNTSQSFLREMERAADVSDPPHSPPAGGSPEPHGMETYEPFPFDAPLPAYAEIEPPVGEKLGEPRPAPYENHAAESPEPAAKPGPIAQPAIEPPPEPPAARS